MTFEIIVLAGFIILAFILRKLKKESSYLKNLSTATTVAGALLAGYFAYDEIIQKKRDKAKLPPVFNVDCKLEKVAEEDSCYLLKASMIYENKSDRRIYIFLSSISVTGIKIKTRKQKDVIKESYEVEGDGYYSRDYEYNADTMFLHSYKIDNDSWFDSDQQATRSLIFKIPFGYDIAALKVDVTLANEDKRNIDTTLFKFKNYIYTNGNLYVDVEYSENGKRQRTVKAPAEKADSIGHVLSEKYGFSHTYSLSEIYLKEKLK